MLIPKDLLYFLLAYVVVVVAHGYINKREFERHAGKAARYQALPLRYKLACRLLVAPSFAAIVVHEGFGFLGLVSFFLLESACIRWYRHAGLL
jgi:hypothetical protein